MFDVFLQIGIAKLLVSVMLAGLALAVQRRVRHPAVAHRSWLLVLVALLVPAVVAIPVLPGGTAASGASVDDSALAADATARVVVGTASPEDNRPDAKAGLAIMWLLGTALLVGSTLFRVLRFRHWLVRTSQPAPRELRDEVSEIGRRLGLTRMPAVLTTTARVSPMVCWTGGRVRIVVPAFLVAALDRHELRAMLAHELAHVRRRDHLVRWIEWLACSAFWWNPVAWWARRELRTAEEASCDALGARAVDSTSRAYARSLLGVVKVMSTASTPYTPVLASGVTSGRSSVALERRLNALVRGGASGAAPRWARPAGVAAAACLLPLGLVYCDTAVVAPEALEESPESPPNATTELIAVVDLNRTDPRAAELDEPGEQAPSASYWIFNTSTGTVGPLPLPDAPEQPLACRLDPPELDEGAHDETMRVCAEAMSDHLRQTGQYDDGNVCVAWGSRVVGWRGVCDTWGPIQRGVRGGKTDVPRLERVPINISSTQSPAGSGK